MGRAQALTLSIPYVVGDIDGDLTAAIVQEVISSPSFEHRTDQGQLLLIVKLIDTSDDNIGFRYEEIRNKEYKRSIIPVETRLSDCG